MVNAVRSTTVLPARQADAAASAGSRPANVLAFTLPPVIGNVEAVGSGVAGSTGAAVMPSDASADAAPGSSASVVEPPASSTWAGLALTVTLPIGSPLANRWVSNAAFSALAAWPAQRGPHARDRGAEARCA